MKPRFYRNLVWAVVTGAWFSGLTGLAQEEAFPPRTEAHLKGAKSELLAAVERLDRMLREYRDEDEEGWKKFLMWERMRDELDRPEGPDLATLDAIHARYASGEKVWNLVELADVRQALGRYLTTARAIDNEKRQVSVTFDELQRLVYSSHVLTIIDAKPELEGSLLALLELRRQNPEASPTDLVEPVRWALEEYRKEALSRTLPVTWRDEVLGRYFLKLCEAPKLGEQRRTVALNLLKVLLAQANPPDLLGKQTVWFRAGGQRLLAVASGPGERHSLVESCTRRAQSDASFAAAMDELLKPEIGIAHDAPPRDILANNEALAQSPTMQELMRLSSLSKDGSPAITMDKLEDLFAAELTAMGDAVRTAQAVYREIGRPQEDLAECPDDPTRVAAMIQRHAEEQAEQRKRIAAANATAMQLSSLVLPIDSKKASRFSAIASNVFTIAAGVLTVGASLAAEPLTLGASTLGVLAGATTIAAGATGLAASLDGDTEGSRDGMTKDEMMLHAIKLVGTMISDLSEEMEYRFDRVDRSLVLILEDLGSTVLLIGEVGHDVKQVRVKLLETQASLNRLERELHSYLIVGFGRELVEHINGDLGYQARTGFPMAYEDYVDTHGPENAFHTWAVHHARDRLASPMPDPKEDLKDIHVLVQLESRPLERNLNYIKEFLEQRLGVSSLPHGPVASLADWYAGANAYLRLAAENPQHFRTMPGSQERLDGVIQAGTELEDFFRAITFVKSESGWQVNRELYDAVVDCYKAKLDTFHKAVDEVEKRFRPDEDFDVSMWRKWEARVPRIPVAETAVIGRSCIRRFPIDVEGIAAGATHSLAIRANGTVVAWGRNHYGQCNVPEGLADVVAVSAGEYHSLALKKDGTIVPWGLYGRFKIPEHKPVTKICVAPHHSLALDEDGRVIAWGNNSHGACDVPDDALTGVIDIAATGIANYDLGDISLALKADGTVVSWGRQWAEPDSPDTAKVPHGLSNVVAIAAGRGRVVAVKADGTVVGWPKPVRRGDFGDPYVRESVTDVAAVALGYDFTLALKKDGGLEVIAGSLEGTPQTGGFVAIAAGGSHALALRDDRTVVAWGDNFVGACGLGDGTHMPVDVASGDFFLMEDGRAMSHRTEIPPDLGRVVAIACGERAISYGIFSPYYLALRPDGNVKAWGRQDTYKQWNVPKGLSGVVAIAAGGEHGHCLALRRDGTVEAWGDNSSGQCNVPPIPKGLDAVAVAAGAKRSLALRVDGTVVAWGNRSYKACNVPEGLVNVVAIAAGRYHNLALKADGTVVAWGENKYGVCNVPKELHGVVAIAAGEEWSLALKADGTVAAWGRNDHGQCDFAAARTGVVAMAATGDSFLVSPTTPSIDNTDPLPFMRGEPPPAVMHRLRALCAHLVDEFDLDLNDSLNQLTGAKALVESVLALGLPDSLDQDDVLRRLLFGSESLIDRDGARALYLAEYNRLHGDEWRRRAPTLEETPRARLESFRRRLNERLDALEESGTAEIPRMVGHTLLQLRLLRAAY